MAAGYSFAPFSQGIPANGQRNNSIGGPQSAVDIRHLQLPNRFVPGQIAPQALLQSPGGGGQLNVDLIRRLMAMFAPQGQQPGVPTLGMPPRLGGFPQGTGLHTQPVPMELQPQAPPFRTQPVPNPNQDVPLTHTPTPTPGVRPGDVDRGQYGPDYNPYTNPANFAPPPTEPVEPLRLPAPEGYHFGTTPPAQTPAKSPLAWKHEDLNVPGLFD